MYESFFGLQEKPFSLLPDPGFLFLSRKHQEALTLLEYGLLNQAGFIVLTGEIGAGKTTLMRYLLGRLDGSINVGLISNTHQSLGDLMAWICLAFDLETGTTGKLDLYRVFVDFLTDQYAKGKHTLLIIDEAQNLDTNKLEELRLLSNVNSDKNLVLQMMLLGQSQLRNLLHQPELQQFAQRVAASYHLGRLSAVDTQNYVRHRISIAGGQSNLFTAKACEAVHHYSTGVPRLINLICDSALVYGYGAGSRIITDEIVDEFVKSGAVHVLTPFEPRKQPHRPRTGQTLDEAAGVRLREAIPQPTCPSPEASQTSRHGGVPHAEDDRNASESLVFTSPSGPIPEGDREPPQRYGQGQPLEARAETVNSHSFRAYRLFSLRAFSLVAILLLLAMGLGLIWYGTPDRNVSPRSLTQKMAESVDIESSATEGQDEMQSEIGNAQQDVATPPQRGSDGAKPSKKTPTSTDRPNPTSDANIPATSKHEPLAAEPAASPTPTRPGRDLHPASSTKSESSELTATGPDERRASTDQALSIGNDTLPTASPLTALRSHDAAGLKMTQLDHALHELAVSVERVGVNHLIANLGEKVQFPDGSVALDSGSQAFLEALALRLKIRPPIQVHVVGHTDHVGAAAVNLRLSERRAEIVAQFLKDKGIPEEYLSSEGKGETMPRVELRQEWALGPSANRRIELELIQQAAGDPKSD